MAKSTSTIKTGTKATFIGSKDYDGALKVGSTVTVKGFDPDENTYAVQDEEGIQDSLFAEEFEIGEATPAKAKTKAAKAEVEAPAKAKAGKAKAEKPAKVEAAKPAKTAKVKPVKEEEEIVLPKFKTTASVKKALADHNGDAIATAAEIAESSEKTVFTLGGVLAYIKRNDSHTEILSDEKDEETGEFIPLYPAGNKGFNLYVQDSLGIASRKADYFVNLYEKFSQITTEAAISKIGWTKLREMLPLDLDESNVEEWLDYAKDASTSELKAEVTKTMVDSGGKQHGNKKDTLMVRRAFSFFEDQDNVVKEAIDKAREVLGDEASDSACAVHIFQEWLNMN
jgi:hypothetical protein